MKRLIVFLVVLSVFISGAATQVPEVQRGNERIKSFSRAKTLLHKVVYSESDARSTFYCGCSYDEKGKIDHGSCGYVPGKDKNRAKRLEWEHVVPAHAFGKDLPEWKKGHSECVDSKGKAFKGRNCAAKMNKLFQFMLADMYNLVPSVGEINGVRSNFPFAEKSSESTPYGKCDFRVVNRKAEPALHLRGQIARIYMYMDSAYPGFGIVNDKNRKIFEEWDKAHPVTIRECSINDETEKLQGNRNLIVFSRCRNSERVKK
jgi:deoxyribonuclease I